MSSPLQTAPDLSDVLLPSTASTPGQLTVLGLALAARQYSLDGLRRNVPELVTKGIDGPEVALIEAFAGMSSQVLYRANQIPRMLLLEFLQGTGIPRKDASPAVALLYGDGDPTRALTYVEGSTVTSGSAQYTLAKTITIPAGARAYGPMPFICTQRGTIGNLPARHAGWATVTPFPIKNLTNPQPAQGGSPAESDEEYISRALGQLGGRGKGTEKQSLASYALSVPGVERVLVLEHTIFRNASRWNGFAYNESNWNGGVYSSTREGAITLVARPYGGGALNLELVRTLGSTLDEPRPEGSVLWIASTEECTLDIGLNVRSDNTLPENILRHNIEDAIRTWCNGSTWPWGQDFRLSELESVASRVAGVRSIENANVTPTTNPLGAWQTTTSGNVITRIATLVPSVIFNAGNIIVTITP